MKCQVSSGPQNPTASWPRLTLPTERAVIATRQATAGNQNWFARNEGTEKRLSAHGVEPRSSHPQANTLQIYSVLHCKQFPEGDTVRGK
jgi:hypothetical protein